MSNSTTRAAYLSCLFSFFFFFNDTATTEIYTLSLHDALPISRDRHHLPIQFLRRPILCPAGTDRQRGGRDRKSTRLNSSHSQISYAVFCLKKKKHAYEISFDTSMVARTWCKLTQSACVLSCFI